VQDRNQKFIQKGVFPPFLSTSLTFVFPHFPLFFLIGLYRLTFSYCHRSLLGRPTLDGKALSFTHEPSFFIFYHFTVLSSHTVNGHQMYSRGLVVGKALIIGIKILPAFPWFSHGSKNAKFGVVFNITQIWVARVWKCSNISSVVRSLRQKWKFRAPFSW